MSIISSVFTPLVSLGHNYIKKKYKISVKFQEMKIRFNIDGFRK